MSFEQTYLILHAVQEAVQLSAEDFIAFVACCAIASAVVLGNFKQ